MFEVNAIREVVVDYFKEHVRSPVWERQKLDGVTFASISDVDNDFLIAPFSMAEIEMVVKACDGNKSPGPDGFNFAFIKHFWYLIKYEVRLYFDQFHGNEVFPKCLLSYFVTLIPKVKSPVSLREFRHISLLGTWYKLLAKVLAGRLSKVMNSVISKSQSSLLKGRHLVDGVLIMNEVVEEAMLQNRECLILKVDFEKAYDSVDWSFLEYMLQRVGFVGKWIAWMKACACGGNMSVLVNGYPTEEIDIQRGLNQGDPLAPFLFLLVAEGFSGLMKNVVDRNLFKGFEVKRGGTVISHLQYADDTLCIGEASIENLWTLKALLRGFEFVSSLKVNFHKSCLMGINVSTEFLGMASTFLNCSVGSFSFMYLGLPMGARAKSMSTWEPMLERIKAKLNSWGNKYISLGGQIVLLNSVPIFYLSFLKIPVKVIKKVEAIQRKFLCGGGRGRGRKNICWVSWRKVCQPRGKGGLGVGDIKLANISLLAKWKWWLIEDQSSLWKDVIHDKYGPNAGYMSMVVGEVWPRYVSRWWKDLLALEPVGGVRWFCREVERKVGNGRDTLFWKDVWVANKPLRDAFPRLFSLALFQDVKVVDVCFAEGDRWRLL